MIFFSVINQIQMKIKQKIVANRLIEEKKVLSKQHGSTPLLMRLQQQYLINKENQSSTYNNPTHIYKVNNNSNASHMDIKIQDMNNFASISNFSEKKLNFNKFGQGMKVYKRHPQQLFQENAKQPYFPINYSKENYPINAQMTQSLEGFTYREMFRSAEYAQSAQRWNTQTDEENVRPLTFGIAKNCPIIDSQNIQQELISYPKIRRKIGKGSLLCSQQYLEEKKIKEEILNGMINRKNSQKQLQQTAKNDDIQNLSRSSNYKKLQLKSQNTLVDSIQGTFLSSISESFGQSLGMTKSKSQLLHHCINHTNKRAKYRLTEDQEDNGYCSKCAINLLQQGFKIQQIKNNRTISVCALKQPSSRNYKDSATKQNRRIKQLSQFEYKIDSTQAKFQNQINKLENCSQIQNVRHQKQRTLRFYEILINHLNHFKQQEVQQLQTIEQQINYKNREKIQQLNERITVLNQLKKQMRQYTSKFMEMKEQQYCFLIDSFFNKVENFQTILKDVGNHKIHQFGQNNSNYFKEKVEKTITLLYNTLTENKPNEISFDKKQEQHSQDFYCQQAKKPFRNLFPDQDPDNYSTKNNRQYHLDQKQLQESPRFK